ncbi:MAG: DUF1501 domain-containing protein [Pirellulales bacterium]
MPRKQPVQPRRKISPVSRRAFLADCGMGFAGLAMAAMLQREGVVRAADSANTGTAAEPAWSPPDGRPHFAPRAKNVIWLFMLGGVSHVEGFDPKPALNQFAGKTIDETPHRDVLSNPLVRGNVREFVANRQIYNTIYPLQVGFAPRGQSGIEVSDWWPHVGSLVDELAVVRSVWVTDNDHAAQYEFHTGHHLFDGSHPSVGAWIKYGLGSLNDNLPSFIALGEPPGTCCGGLGAQGASYLGPEHNAVGLSIDPANPLPFASPGGDVSSAEQRAKFDLLRELHEQRATAGIDDPVLAARIKSYELAFRMQTSVPEALGFADETAATRRLYGLDVEPTASFGQRCLAARRLVERGVRFVQVYHGDGLNSLWDAHTKLRENHSKLCPQVDQPIAGLLADLKQRGLLDETIVVWGSEFGRTPGAEKSDGRDHHPYGFTVWMAGGGLKQGVVHGATDELGFHAVEHRHYITDIHATILHQLGLDPHRLEVPGRKRLEIDRGEPIREIIA